MRVALLPGVLALLPEYAGLTDPVADLRAACLRAVSWLAETGHAPVVVADAQGARVAQALLAEARLAPGLDLAAVPDHPASAPAYLVVANGSARRTEKAPGYLDDRAAGFDAALGAALAGPDPAALAGLDTQLASELWVGGVPGLVRLGQLLVGAQTSAVDYDDDPFGVQYWVMRWTCES